VLLQQLHGFASNPGVRAPGFIQWIGDLAPRKIVNPRCFVCVLSVFCLKNLVFLHETMMISSQKKTRRLMPFMGSGGNWAQCEAKGKQQ